ncbi:MAG: hypothetical protein ACP5GJ_03795 [Nanopusillaceae archaeon]
MKGRFGIILLALLILGFVLPIVVYNVFVLHSFTISCSYESKTVNVGSSVNYLCYDVYNLTQGDNIFTIPLPGAGNILSSYISFINVQTPTININLSGTIPSNSQQVQQISIPSNAYNINIYGILQGIPVNNQYPFNASITGGNIPLYCSPSCIYNQGLIINQSGSYQLVINSGYGGGGVNYDIYGSYNLPNPTYTISVNGVNVFSGQIASTQSIPIPINQTSTVNINVNGYSNAQALFYIEQKCSLTGGFWNCSASVNPQNLSQSLVVCTTNVYSTCSLSNINIEVPFSSDYSKYLSNAQNLEISVNGVIVNANTQGLSNSAPYFIIYNLDQGNNIVQLSFTLPYIVPQAQTQVGVCLIYPPSITIYRLLNQASVSTTIYIKNTGNAPIQVTISPSVSLNANIQPSSLVIQPGETANTTVTITGGNGYLEIQGCSEIPYDLPVSVQVISSSFIVLIIIVAGLAALVLMLFTRGK